MIDWTPEEEEAFKELERRLCPTPSETLQQAARLPVAEIYACEMCGEYHVRSLVLRRLS